MNNNLPAVYVRQELILPSNDQWQNRFEIHSESSNRVYIVAQNINKKHWACSCPGWKRHRKCKHLEALNLPVKEVPYEINLIKR